MTVSLRVMATQFFAEKYWTMMAARMTEGRHLLTQSNQAARVQRATH